MNYLVVAHLQAKAGEEERVAEGLRVNEAASRQEPGVVACADLTAGGVADLR